MKRELKGFVCGVLVCVCSFGVVSFANGNWKTIDVLENDIAVIVNGSKVDKENFIYNDTTYLPIRAVSEALGKDVTYDENTKTATIKEKESGPMENEFSSDGLTIYNIESQKYVKGKDVIGKYNSYITFIAPNDKSNMINVKTNEILKEDIEFIIYNDDSYFQLDYYENTMLPIIKKISE